MACPHAMRGCICVHCEDTKRIAELVAELAEYREAASYGRDMKARAEKAEAEVERLRSLLSQKPRENDVSLSQWDCPCAYCRAARKEGDNR